MSFGAGATPAGPRPSLGLGGEGRESVEGLRAACEVGVAGCGWEVRMVGKGCGVELGDLAWGLCGWWV